MNQPNGIAERRILITGASGTLGFNIVQLLAANAGNRLLLPLRAFPPEFECRSNIEICRVNLSDFHGIDRILTEFRPEIIIHCAASGVRPERSAWFEMVSFNVDATLRLFQSSCAIPGCEFLYISTGLVYRHQGRPLRETDPVESLHPYGVSKAAADFLLQAAATEFQRTLTILRPFSFTGPRDGGSRLFPSLLGAAARGVPFRLSPGEQVRDFCAVQDISTAVQQCLRRQRAEQIEIFNVGSGSARSLRSIVQGICEELDIPVELYFGDLPYPPHEPMHLVADITKLTQLNWFPATSLSLAVWQLAQEQFPELTLRRPDSHS